jgi:phage terminase large subunit GpA-like protein
MNTLAEQDLHETDIYEGDIDFLIEQLGKLTDSLIHEPPSEFIERVRYIPKGLTPFPGKFSFDKFPYFRKIVDCFNPLDPTKEVVFMKGNQIGATTAVLETIILYNIMSDPKAQMCVTADAGLARTNVQTRIETMIDNAGARDLIFSQSRKKKGSRNTGDTTMEKQYPGGYIHFFGGRSPARFRGTSYPVALADEVDSFPDKIPKEGTVVDLVRNRTDAYSIKRKILWTSTPTTKESSKIEGLFKAGDQQKFYVPCKHCGTMQELVWHGENKETGYIWGIVWENDSNFVPITEDIEKGIETTVAYKCCNPDCGGLMKNYDKATIIPRGEWRPTAAAKAPNTKSFHITPLYNPPGMFSWDDMVKLWADCWDIERNKLRDREKYRVFRNTKQGLTFEDNGKEVEYERAVLFRRTGFVRGHIPNDMAVADSGSPILFVAASVDVQQKNLFVDVKGYSDGGSTWTLDFFSIPGETEQFNGPWDKLDEYISDTRFIGTDGKVYRIQTTLVDSGYYTNYVYEFVNRHPFGIYACKGRDWIKTGETYELFSPKALQHLGMDQVFHINTGKLKDKISALFSMTFWETGQFQPSWYPNFPEDFRDDYFKMFAAETRNIVKFKDSDTVARVAWRQKFGQDNHAFDTYVYNLAALEIAAEYYCKNELFLPALNWRAFWEAAKTGAFYEDPLQTQ